MKTTFISAAFCCFLSSIALAQLHSTFTVSGKNIIDPCGNTFIPRGVNYSLADDWNFPGNLNTTELSAQIVQANPNAVRIQWYADYGQPSRPAYALSDLDSVVSRFARANVVSIVELHDLTGSQDYSQFNSRIMAWWLRPDVLQFINKHQSHLIVNLANEFGPVVYASPGGTANPNYNSEIPAWVTNYQNAISSMRTAGVTVPLMVDATDYADDLQMALSNGATLENYDPLHNIIMSVHGFWESTLQTLSIQAESINQAPFPIILGEVGNADAHCNTLYWYNYLMQDCQAANVGWLAWTWNRDTCSERNMTLNTPSSAADGQFITLTPFGNSMVNDTAFGLATHATKACFSGSGTGIKNVVEDNWTIYPNPVSNYINIASLHNASVDAISIWNLSGQKMDIIQTKKNSNGAGIYTGNLAAGVYMLRFTDEEGNGYYQKFVKE